MACMRLSERQLYLSGVSGADRTGSPGQRAPITATGTFQAGATLALKQCHLGRDIGRG